LPREATIRSRVELIFLSPAGSNTSTSRCTCQRVRVHASVCYSESAASDRRELGGSFISCRGLSGKTSGVWRFRARIEPHPQTLLRDTMHMNQRQFSESPRQLLAGHTLRMKARTGPAMVRRVAPGWPLFLRSAAGIIRALLALYGLSVLLIFYSPIADYLVQPLWLPADLRPAPAIVVLTAYVTENGVLNEQALRRTHAAARLYRDRLSSLVIFSGGRPHAEFMAQFAGELGVPRSAILLEEESRNTYTSAVYVAAICRSRGIQRVLLVTDAAHMRRAVAAFHAQNLGVSPVPADPWSLGWETPQIRLRKFLAALHEYGGLLYYRWKGWI